MLQKDTKKRRSEGFVHNLWLPTVHGEYWIERGFPCSYVNAHTLNTLREPRGGDTVLHKVIIKYVKKIFLQFKIVKS